MEGARCGLYRDRIVEAATGPVPPDVWEDLWAHLSGCPRCRAEFDAVRDVVAWLREVPEPPVPAGFWEELDRRLQRGAAHRRLLAGARVEWGRAAKAAALAALLALAALRGMPPPDGTGSREVVSPAVQALLPRVAELAQAWGAGLEGEGDRW